MGPQLIAPAPWSAFPFVTQKRGHGRRCIARLMHHAGLCGRQKGRYRVQTTDRNHDHPIALIRLAVAPEATAPNQIWVADITYIPPKASF